ncbi:hypothetical protein BcDW1_10918 [Botrytis cinerea BcDW1]|uniref:Uncharacterized protein n=1 Tax=Botryotinia fuckeliana (strain BcDW1) TaxID=1290391 RepID=M7UAX8_BOTF1|nr:hypothetical protein BcDW1_10918 [Botrytis cinerea BcDW1]
MKLKEDLRDELKLERDYQDLREKKKKPKLHKDDLKKLKYFEEEFEEIDDHRIPTQASIIRHGLEEWSARCGTRSKKASVIMEEYSQLGENNILKKRNKEDKEKEKKKLKALKKGR